MSLLYLAGELFNQVGRGPYAVTALGGTADSNFPVANLYSGRPRKPFSFTGTGSSQRIDVDTNLIANWDMELGTGDGAGSTLDNWTDLSLGSAEVQRSSIKHIGASGTYSMRLISTVGTENVRARHDDITVRSGERLKLEAEMDSDNAGGSALWSFQVFNRDTGRYLNSDGTWTIATADTALAGAGGAVQQTLSQTFQVESRADCGGLDTVALRIDVLVRRDGTNNSVLYVDDVTLVPAMNFVGVFGHNFAPVTTPVWRSLTGGTVGRKNFSKGVDGIPNGPSFYGYLDTALYIRDWDFVLSGTAREAPRMGELVMGYAETLARPQNFGWSQGYVQPQARVVTPERAQHVASRGSHPVRAVTLPFTHFSLAQRNEIRDEILARTDYGRLPMIVVPASDEPDVIFGRVADSWDVRRRWNVISDDTLVIEEDPHMEWIDG